MSVSNSCNNVNTKSPKKLSPFDKKKEVVQIGQRETCIQLETM